MKKRPRTIEEAVEMLLADLDEREKEKLRSLPENDLILAHFNLGLYIRNTYGLWDPDCPLLQQDPFVHTDDLSMNIIEKAWRGLRGSESK